MTALKCSYRRKCGAYRYPDTISPMDSETPLESFRPKNCLLEELGEPEAALAKLGVAAIGVGLGLGLVAIGAYLYFSPSTGWNSKAIRATYLSSDYSATPAPAGYFTYTLENTSGKDYSVKLLDESQKNLPLNLRVAARRGPVNGNGDANDAALIFGGISLFLQDANLDSSIEQQVNGEPLFLPAKQRVRVIVRWEFSEEEQKKSSSARIVNTSLFGFVLYDDATRYEIDFPRPARVEGEFTEADAKQPTEKSVNPATLKPWEKYAICDRNEKIVASCKATNLFKPIKAGYWIEPLPVLPPRVPAGYTLDADESLCNDAAQWYAYCWSSK